MQTDSEKKKQSEAAANAKLLLAVCLFAFLPWMPFLGSQFYRWCLANFPSVFGPLDVYTTLLGFSVFLFFVALAALIGLVGAYLVHLALED